GLDLALLVHAEHQRLVGGVEVEADNVADLLDEERIRREFEALGAVRLDAEEREVALDRTLADARLRRDAPHRPLGGIGRGRAQHGPQELRDLIVVMRPGATHPGRITRSPSLPAGLVRRAEIILRSAAGATHRAIAAAVGVSLPLVAYWRRRF